MATIQISSGRGPLECELAVGLYLAFFLKQYPKASVTKEQRNKVLPVAGKMLTVYKNVLLDLPDGQKVHTGAVKWICQSPVRPGLRRKNWFIDVSLVSDAVASSPLENVDINPADLETAPH